MPMMPWDDTLDVGVNAMNEEHKLILNAMNDLFDACKAGRFGEEVNRLVDRLGRVCVDHFRDEEAYMASIDFPGLKSHRLIHEQLLNEFAVHAAEVKATGGRTNERFFNFLRHWLMAHIKVIDKKYGAHASVSPGAMQRGQAPAYQART